MKVGSLVECVTDFKALEIAWGVVYPKKGDILTVVSIDPHPAPDVRKKGIVLLHLEELRAFGICDKTIYGKVNFVEVVPPFDLYEALLAEEMA